MLVKIFSDGGARGNPGPAAAGVLVFDEDNKLLNIDGKYLGEITNNQAEYKAIILGLKLAERLQSDKVYYYLDSELAVNQLNGEYKVKNNEIKKLKNQIDKLIMKFSDVQFFHIVREKNKLADKMVNLIIDAVLENT